MAFVYMLECSDGSFYVGSTVLRLEERLHQHQEGLGAAYTARRRPVRLVWHEEHEHVGAAFAREKQIQNWGRPQRLGGLDHRTMRSSANTRWHTPPVVRLDREDEARGLLEAGTYAYFATGA